MLKKSFCVIMALAMFTLPQINVKAATNANSKNLTKSVQAISPNYEKHYTVRLNNLNLKIENGDVKVSPKDEVAAIIDKSDIDSLQNMMTNKNFVSDLKKMINDGHTPIAIGVAEAKILNTKDKDGKVISSRPMTVDEVTGNKVYKLASGQTQTRDNLSLYTTVSGSAPDYWVQSNAYWSGMGDTSSGDEKLGITWDSTFSANNSSSSTINYSSYTGSGSMDAFSPNQGVDWDFANSKYVGNSPWYLTGAYVGISVHRNSSSAASHFFTSNYIHTYQSYNGSASISYNSDGKTNVTITLSGVPSQWPLVSYINGTF